MKRKLKGFTLVELVITIAIVIILSVISVPIYRGYVTKAMYSEGYALLGTILSAQKAYYSEYGNFLRDTNSSGKTSYEPVFSLDARGNKYFTLFKVNNQENEDATKLFKAVVWKPEDLCTNGYTVLKIYYITTSGASIYEANFGD